MATSRILPRIICKAKNAITGKSNLRAVLLLIDKMMLSCVTNQTEDMSAWRSSGLWNEDNCLYQRTALKNVSFEVGIQDSNSSPSQYLHAIIKGA